MFANFYQLSMKHTGRKAQDEILQANHIQGQNEWHNEICTIFWMNDQIINIYSKYATIFKCKCK